MKLVECIPNFSEGRDPRVVETIREAIAAVPGIVVLHVTADASHNRSVITFAGPHAAVGEAAFAAIRAARDAIDLTRHAGVHPRIGAADVVPFVPLDGATMDDCIALARAVGERVGRELAIPVYLYERAATRAGHRNLADVRRGGLEGLARVIGTDPARAPDFGPHALHPTAGAVAIGARPFLVAFNAYVGDASQLDTARAIARAVRESSGGLPGVKALGLAVAGEAQVSMNLVDLERTGLADAIDAVEREAVARATRVTWTEIIGLVPERTALEVGERRLRLRDALAEHVLERRLLAAGTSPTIHAYLDALAGGGGTPGGGSAAALAGALAAALAAMVANITLARPRFAGVHPEMRAIAEEATRLAAELDALRAADAGAFARVTDARARPAGTAPERAARDRALQEALLGAARVPHAVAAHAARVAELCAAVAARGNPNARTDAAVGAELALAAARAAFYNVRVNVATLAADPEHLLERSAACVDRAAAPAAAAVHLTGGGAPAALTLPVSAPAARPP